MPNSNITYFAKTNFRNQEKPFGIKQNDRLAHMYVIGRTGVGKSTLLHTMMVQDMMHGRGFSLIDPHGDLVQKVMEYLPEHRKKDVIYFDATDPDIRYGYNPFRKVSKERRPLQAAGILSVFKHLFSKDNGWGGKIEHVLRYSILAVLDQPTANFTCLTNLLTDKYYRKRTEGFIRSPDVLSFVKRELPYYRLDSLMPVLNKVGTFAAYPQIKKILVENEAQLSMRRIMDENKILLMNLSKGVLGTDVSHILGSVMISALNLAAFSRADTSEEERIPHYIFADEFQNYTSGSDLPSMLSELRKFKIGMVMAHQYINQLSKQVSDAVFGNVGTLISFRVGSRDAPFLAKEFYPVFSQEDLVNLPNYQIYLKLMIDGKVGRGFSGRTTWLDKHN